MRMIINISLCSSAVGCLKRTQLDPSHAPTKFYREREIGTENKRRD
jgi:hypothetical protein